MSGFTIDLRVIATLYVLVLAIGTWLLLRGIGHLRDGKVARGLLWISGTVFGLGFLALTTVSGYMEEDAFGRYDLFQELIRGLSLIAGVIFVVYALAALLPVVLDTL